jgi:SAM-dependent methyltransferase
MDRDHLAEEEEMAKTMEAFEVDPTQLFSREQWALSKKEFWGIVKGNIQEEGKTFLYAGSGYDNSFQYFERTGNLFVNFDMVFSTLLFLQSSHGAESCIAGDINCPPFKNDSFDYIVVIDVIHHEYCKLPQLLKGLTKRLKEGGTLFLQDLNSFAIYNLPKTIFLPKSLYRTLRRAYHRHKMFQHKTADYEFPTSPWKVRKILSKLGYGDVELYPNTSYPDITRKLYKVYKDLSFLQYVKKYHNYHYSMKAVKGKLNSVAQ